MGRHLWMIFTLLLTLAFGCPGEASAAFPKDKLVQTVHPDSPHEALLTDASSLLRLCNARPERIVPAANFVLLRHLSKLPSFYKSKFYQTLLLDFRGKSRTESAPYRFGAACRYYVFCLGHLLC